MKKIKRIIIVCLCLICVSVCAYRIYKINSGAEKVRVKYYSVGSKAPYERDYNMASNMIADGYSIEVLGSSLYKKQDFMDEYDIDYELADFTKYLYVADVKIYNANKENSEEVGISLLFLPLVTDVDYVMASEDLTLALNDNLPQSSFSLRHESSMDIRIVYELNEPYFRSKKQVMDKEFKILMTQYPTRKVLELP